MGERAGARFEGSAARQKVSFSGVKPSEVAVQRPVAALAKIRAFC
jgi:hypothetical protein